MRWCRLIGSNYTVFILLISITTLATSKHAATCLRRPRARFKLGEKVCLNEKLIELRARINKNKVIS